MSQVKRLAYIEIEVSDISTWRKFATEILACEVVDGIDSKNEWLRFDDRPWRVHLSEGPKNDLVVIGLEVNSREDLSIIHERLKSVGHQVRIGTDSEKSTRGVQELLCFNDPSGMEVELSYGSLMRPQEPCNPPIAHGGFVTENQGLGHLMLVVEDVPAVHKFYCDMLGFVTSDYVSTRDYGGLKGDFIFMRCNERHHTIAIGCLPIPRRLGHLMIQVKKFDDVGLALDRVIKSDFRQTRSLGKHINDKMFSFYVESPSGVQIEYGWGGIEVEESMSDVKTYDVTSLWGHQHLKK